MEMITYRVLIADDHPLARKAVQSMLGSDPAFIVVGEAKSGGEAVHLCAELQPDLVLMDVHMSPMDGLEATQLIKQRFPHIRVVILTVSDDIADLFTAVQFGAQGYLLKNMDPDEWIAYLHALAKGDMNVARDMADRLFHQFRSGSAEDDHNPSPDILTARERDIIQCVAAGENNRQIAGTLLISENTVKNHMKNILEKLNLDNRVQLTAYAIKRGLTRNRHSIR